MGEASQIEVRGLTMGYGERVVQRDVSFTARRGEIFVIMGDSGCGKSTLMRHMIGLNEPRAGDVFYEGEGYWAADPDRMRELAAAARIDAEVLPVRGGADAMRVRSTRGDVVLTHLRQLGDSLGLAKSLDDSRQPVDRDVFTRELAYYEIREQ